MLAAAVGSESAGSSTAQRPGVDTEDDAVPELAKHERGRKLPHKRETSGAGTKWGASGSHNRLRLLFSFPMAIIQSSGRQEGD